MKKRLLTVLVALVIVVGTMAIVGQAATDALTGNVDSKTISENTTLDLAGYSIGTLTVEEGVTVVITGAANTGVITTVQGGGTVQLADGYMLYGSTSNKLTLGTAGISLRADDLTNNGASVYYTSTFGGNANVKNKITAYGVALYVNSAENLFAPNTYTRIDDLSGWNTGVASFNDNGVLLKGILKTGSAYSLNKANAKRQIYNVPYVELADGTRITGATVNRSLQNVVEQVTASNNPGSDFWDTGVSYTQKVNVANLYNTFENIMSSWNIPRLSALVDGNKNTAYSLYTVSDVQMMSQFPNESFFLEKYLNLGGVTLNTIENFTGSIDGNGHTLGNFKLNGIGFVDQVAAGQSITELYLSDVTMTVPSDSTAQNVGMIAGTNYGSITGVAASGTIKDTRSGTANAKLNIGALVGKSTGTVSGYGIFKDTVSVYQLNNNGVSNFGIKSEPTVYETTGLTAIVGFNTTGENVNTGLVASGTVSNAASVYWRDTSNNYKFLSKELQTRRETVVAETYNSGTYAWTPAQSFTHYTATSVHEKTFTSGQKYVGTPYDHRSTPYAQAMEFARLNSAGTNYVMDVSSVTDNWTNNYDNTEVSVPLTSPYDGYTSYIGSDCSSACIVAWQQVSPILLSSKTNGGASFGYTATMVPSQFNQYYYGVQPVGYTVDDATMNTKMTYACDLHTWSASIVHQDATGIVKDADGNDRYYPTSGHGDFNGQPMYSVNTLAIGSALYNQAGSAQGVYETYAKTRKGDILINGGPGGYGGHARMASEDAVVIRNGNDDIDANKSYFLINEQGDGLYDFDYTRSSWRINHKYTFAQLAFKLSGSDWASYSGSKGVYLPITIKALNDESIKQGTLASGATYAYSPENTKINSTARIMSATLIIYDASGEEVYTKTYYQSAISGSTDDNGNNTDVSFSRCNPGYVPFYSKYFVKDTSYKDDLPAGTYTYDFKVKLFGGQEKMLSSVLKQGQKDSIGGTTNYKFTVN